MKKRKLKPWSYAAKAGDPTTPLDTHLKKNAQVKKKNEDNKLCKELYATWI